MLLERLNLVDPKLQVWDPLLQKYTRLPATMVPTIPGITYQTRDLTAYQRDLQEKAGSPDPTPRQRGGWSHLTGYTPTKGMPPVILDDPTQPRKIT